MVATRLIFATRMTLAPSRLTPQSPMTRFSSPIRFPSMFARSVSLAAGLLLTLPTLASAQTDTLYPVGGSSVRGTIEKVSKDGVTMRTGQAERTFLPAQIEQIAFQSEPSGLTRGREALADGDYDQALEELRTVDPAKVSRDVIKQDVQFYRILCEAKLALAGRGDRSQAVASAIRFAGGNRNSWRFYPTAKLLGDLAVSLENYDRAIQYYGSLESAPAPESKVEMRYLIGVTYLERGDTEKALEEFERVAGVASDDPAIGRIKRLATAAKAVALARSGKAEEGVSLATGLIDQIDRGDAEFAARVYNALGACHEAAGDAEGAVLAYLHTHLLFSSVAPLHAEALVRLRELWTTVGHADRSEEALQELIQRYPAIAERLSWNTSGSGRGMGGMGGGNL